MTPGLPTPGPVLRAAINIAIALAMVATPGRVAHSIPAGETRVPDVEVFVRDGCPRCADAKRFLDALRGDRPDLVVVVWNVGSDPEARERLRTLAAAHGAAPISVPAFLVRGSLIVGFLTPGTTGGTIVAALDQVPTAPVPAGPEAACGVTETTTCSDAAPTTLVYVPWWGPVDARVVGLPTLTLLIGLLDGFNPCAMWVLLFLLSLLVNLRDRTKMLVIAGTFVVISGLAYFAFMAAWLNVFLLLGWSRWLQVVLGGVAVCAGLINVKDSVAFGRGPSLSIPDAAKPGIYARVRRILYAERLVAALAAAAVLAVMVNTVELLCTAGFPALYTQILTMRALPAWQYYGYLTLYNVAYMFDDSIVVAVAVVTLSQHKLQQRAGRWLKLVSGSVMMGLGLVLIAAPEWLAW